MEGMCYRKALRLAVLLGRHRGAAAFDRMQLLLCVFHNPVFRQDHGITDDHQAARALDEYVADLGFTFSQMRDLVAFYPERQQWQGRGLYRMFMEMVRS